MSVPDVTPLPRQGEVFFDVRGQSRSMRLSWYAGTGIAVFSIWHAGTCTGTFRLPIADLPRMAELLTSGPAGAASAPPAAGAATAPTTGATAAAAFGAQAGSWEEPSRQQPAGDYDQQRPPSHRRHAGAVADADDAPGPAGAGLTGPLPVGHWRARDPAFSSRAAGPAEGPADDPLATDYRDEEEQGYLPGPPTASFAPVLPDPHRPRPREREYGSSRPR